MESAHLTAEESDREVTELENAKANQAVWFQSLHSELHATLVNKISKTSSWLVLLNLKENIM